MSYRNYNPAQFARPARDVIMNIPRSQVFFPNGTFRPGMSGYGSYGEDTVAVPPIAQFLPANPYAVPLQTGGPNAPQQAMTLADCGPGMTREPLLGQCLPTGTDPTMCPPGMTYKPGQGCLFIPQGTGCPPGMTGDPLGVSCWPNNIPGAQPTQPNQGGGCPTGYAKDPVLGTSCIPTSWPVPGNVPGQGVPTAPGCFFGQVKDASGACVWPFCLPGMTFNVQTGACEPTNGNGASSTGGGYDMVRQACDLLPAALRPASCGAPPAGTSSTTAGSLSLLCGLIPPGWPVPPGCGPSTVKGGTETPGTKVGGSVTSTEGLGLGAALLALAGVGLVGGLAVVIVKKAQKKKGGR